MLESVLSEGTRELLKLRGNEMTTNAIVDKVWPGTER